MLRARECLAEIVDLYQEGSGKKEPELLDRVTDLLLMTADQQSAEDRDVFGDVMERMAYAIDPITRARFAERISTFEEIPIELILRLARDEISIARPILQYSPCLRESDLEVISSDAEQDHMRAMAQRKSLTQPVTDILVERGDLYVLKTVISNTGAEFSDESMAELSKSAEQNDELQQMFSLRRDLAPSPLSRLKRLTEREFWLDMSKSFLMADEELDESNINEIVEMDVAEKDENPEPEKIQPIEDKWTIPIEAVNPSTEKTLVESARSGNVAETIEVFAKITQLEKIMIEHCLLEAHISALMVLCKAHNFAPPTFTALMQFRDSQTGEPTEDTAGLMRRYEGMTTETAKRIIRFSDKQRKAAKENTTNIESD